VIASGLSAFWQDTASAPPPAPQTVPTDQREPLPQATYDPYAGASIRRD